MVKLNVILDFIQLVCVFSVVAVDGRRLRFPLAAGQVISNLAVEDFVPLHLRCSIASSDSGIKALEWASPMFERLLRASLCRNLVDLQTWTDTDWM